MARKQTLKSLLGGSDNRVQTDLNLDETSFTTPRIQAGNYRVTVQDTPRTNTAGLISDALGEFAGPVLNQYKSLQKQKQEEYAEIASILTPDQAAAVSNGDISSVEASLGKTADKLNSLQRKRLLKFVDNPNNYRLAANVIGTKVAGQYGLDLMENLEAYAKSDLSPEEQFQEVRNKLIEANDIQGHALVGFMAEAARQEERYAPRIVAMQNERTEETVISNSMVVLAHNVKQGDYGLFSTNFNEYFAGYTPAEQATYLSELVGGLIDADDFKGAEDLVGWLATSEQGIKMGTEANLSDGILNQLVERIEAEKISEDQITTQAVGLQRKNIQEGVVSMLGYVGQEDAPEQLTIDINGVPTEIKTAGTKTEVLDNYRNAIANSDLSNTEKGMHFNEISRLGTIEQNRLTSTYNSAAVPNLVSELSSSLNIDINGENILGMSNDAILDKVTGLEDELKEGVDAIYADNEKTEEEKRQAASRFVLRRSMELKTEVDEQRANYDQSTRVQNTLTSLGMGLGGNFNTQITTELTDWFSDMEGGTETIEGLRTAMVEEATESITAIISAPLTDAEKQNLPKAYGDRNRAASNAVQDVLAGLEQRASNKYNEITKVEEKVIETDTDTDTETPLLVVNPNAAQWGKMPDGYNPRNRNPSFEDKQYRKYVRTIKRLQKRRDIINNPEQMYQRTGPKGSGRFPLEMSEITASALVIRDTAYSDQSGFNVLIDGKAAVTPEELRTGKVHGRYLIDTSKLSLETSKTVPLLSLDIIANPNTDKNLALLKEYADVLNIDFNDENEMNKLLTFQNALYIKEYGVNPYSK